MNPSASQIEATPCESVAVSDGKCDPKLEGAYRNAEGAEADTKAFRLLLRSVHFVAEALEFDRLDNFVYHYLLQTYDFVQLLLGSLFAGKRISAPNVIESQASAFKEPEVLEDGDL